MKHKYCTALCFTILLFIACADYDLIDDKDKEIDRVDLAITKVTDSSVTLKWSKYDDDDFKYYVVLYGTHDIVDWNDKIADSLMFDFDTVKIVQPLDDRARYYFRVMVLNENGIFSGSNTVDTITPEDMKGKLRLSAPQRKDNGNIGLVWTSSIDDFDRYAVYADTVKTVDTTDTLLETVYSDTTKTVSGLTESKTWWLRVYAMNDSAIVATSNAAAIYAKEE